jgi:hypothetical protein
MKRRVCQSWRHYLYVCMLHFRFIPRKVTVFTWQCALLRQWVLKHNLPMTFTSNRVPCKRSNKFVFHTNWYLQYTSHTHKHMNISHITKPHVVTKYLFKWRLQNLPRNFSGYKNIKRPYSISLASDFNGFDLRILNNIIRTKLGS